MDDDSPISVPPGPEVTQKLFLKWRSPRSGNTNPERMNNPVWEWLVSSRLNAFQANVAMKGPSPFKAGPCWSFDRFGQTTTHVADGRLIWIGGEHEDSYDPDFHIYNDVVVRLPDGKLEIFGYPRSVFPPTDFHTASLLDNHIVIIGCLGYPAERRPGQTFVALLNLENFEMAEVATGGTSPGWLHRHTAEISEDKSVIVVSGGKLHTGDEALPLLDNIDDWELDTRTWQWRQLTHRQWPCRIVSREDGGLNHYWEIEQAVWSYRLKWKNQFHKQVKELEAKLGVRPDLELFASLFRPSVPHETLPELEGELHVFRIRVEGVIVRYALDMASVQMRVDGLLPESLVDAIAADLVQKWSALENHPFESRAA